MKIVHSGNMGAIGMPVYKKIMDSSGDIKPRFTFHSFIFAKIQFTDHLIWLKCQTEYPCLEILDFPGNYQG